MHSARRWLGNDRRPTPQPMLQGHPKGITQKGHQHVGLDPWFLLMEQRPDRKLALERAKRRLGFGELHIFRPQLLRRVRRQIGAQHVSALPQVPPSLTVGFHFPNQTYPGGSIPQSDFEQIVHGRVSRLNPSQSPLHLVAVLQSAAGDAFLQGVQSRLHARGKPLPDRLLFLLAAGGAAQDVRLFSLGNRDLLYLHIGTHLSPVVLQQLGFKPLHLAARCAYQILSTPFANRRQILLAHDPTIPRFITQMRRALPYLRSTIRRIVSMVVTSARLPSNVS